MHTEEDQERIKRAADQQRFRRKSLPFLILLVAVFTGLGLFFGENHFAVNLMGGIFWDY